MIDLDKIDFKNIINPHRDSILQHCVEEYFGDINRDHSILLDFSGKFTEYDFTEYLKPSYNKKWFKCDDCIEWLNKRGDRIWFGNNYYMRMKMDFYTSSFVLPPWEETLYFLKHIDDFRLDVIKVIKIVELNQRINDLEKKENKR